MCSRFIFLLTVFSCLYVSSTYALADTATFKTPRPLIMGVKTSHIDGAKIADSDYKLAISSASIKLPLGKYNVLGQTFVPQVAIEQTRFNIPNPNFDQKNMYTIKLPMLFIEQYDQNWTRILNITPSWHTDLKAKDEESYSLMGLLLWRYKDDSPHSYTMGVGVNRLFGEYKPVPMGAYSYQASAQTRYDLGFPATKVEHRGHQNWSVFSSIAPMGGNWRYESQAQTRVNLSYRSWVATFGVRRNLVEKFWLTFEAGRTFSRKLDLNNNTSDSQEVDISDANIIMLSIGLHP